MPLFLVASSYYTIVVRHLVTSSNALVTSSFQEHIDEAWKTWTLSVRFGCSVGDSCILN